MSYEWAHATARFGAVANFDDGTVEELEYSKKSKKRVAKLGYGIALDDGSAEAIVYGTPAQLIAFGERFSEYARNIAAELGEDVHVCNFEDGKTETHSLCDSCGRCDGGN